MFSGQKLYPCVNLEKKSNDDPEIETLKLIVRSSRKAVHINLITFNLISFFNLENYFLYFSYFFLIHSYEF